MGLVRFVADYNVGRFQISMNIALGMDTVQSIHKLQSNDYDSLNLELALFERFLELFQIHSKQLHYEVVVVLIGAVTVQTREADPSILLSKGRLRAVLGHAALLLLEQFLIQLNRLRILIMHAIFSERLLFGEFHHILHETDFSLKFGLILTRLLHLKEC